MPPMLESGLGVKVLVLGKNRAVLRDKSAPKLTSSLPRILGDSGGAGVALQATSRVVELNRVKKSRLM